MITKACKKCGITKPSSSFYKNKSKTNGIASSCIECEKAHHKVRIKRQDHLDLRQKILDRWKERNQDKCNAHKKVRSAIRSGKLHKKSCLVCGKSNAHGHHDDYKKPLHLMWLCPQHHTLRHKVFKNNCALIPLKKHQGTESAHSIKS